jgi:hypothetical protein
MLTLSSRLLTSRSSWLRSYPRLKVLRRRELEAVEPTRTYSNDP